jgi:16S rRNA G1207 methylase RsmC
VLFPLIDEAYEHLRVHGRLYLVLMRTAGVRRHMKHTFGNCEVAADEGRYTVLAAERTS